MGSEKIIALCRHCGEKFALIYLKEITKREGKAFCEERVMIEKREKEERRRK